MDVSVSLPFVETYETVFAALADPTRRALLERLREGPRSVAELAEGMPISRPAVSQHLKVLHDCGLVAYEPVGTRNLYRVEPAGLVAVRAWLDHFWGDVLDRYADLAKAEAAARAAPAEEQS